MTDDSVNDVSLSYIKWKWFLFIGTILLNIVSIVHHLHLELY
jgi:hypothetical protein